MDWCLQLTADTSFILTEDRINKMNVTVLKRQYCLGTFTSWLLKNSVSDTGVMYYLNTYDNMNTKSG
jgi:hypothetical protein